MAYLEGDTIWAKDVCISLTPTFVISEDADLEKLKILLDRFYDAASKETGLETYGFGFNDDKTKFIAREDFKSIHGFRQHIEMNGDLFPEFEKHGAKIVHTTAYATAEAMPYLKEIMDPFKDTIDFYTMHGNALRCKKFP